MKRTTFKTGLTALLFLLLALAFLISCPMDTTLTVTIYNSTKIATGDLRMIYGNYSGYADGEEFITNPVFPYTYTISGAARCSAYIVYAELQSAAGTSTGYTFFDTNTGDSQTGAFDLMLYINNGVDDYEPDNAMSAARVIQAGEYQARSLTNSSDVDYVSFYATAGYLYEIGTVIPSSVSTNTVLYLYDAASTQLAYDYSGGEDYGESLISWTAPASGVYYIMVDGYGTSSGSYGLTLGSYTTGGSLISPLPNFNKWSKK